MVGARGFEPLTPSASRKCSPPELSAHVSCLGSDAYCSSPQPNRQSPVGRSHRADRGSIRARKRGCAPGRGRGSLPLARGRGSAGRAQPCQGWGRGFESRRPLHQHRGGRPEGVESARMAGLFLITGPLVPPRRRRSQVARQRPAKPLSPVRIRASPPWLRVKARPATGRAFFLADTNHRCTGDSEPSRVREADGSYERQVSRRRT